MIQRDVWLVVEGWKGEHEGDYVSDCVCMCVAWISYLSKLKWIHFHPFEVKLPRNPGPPGGGRTFEWVTAESQSVPGGVESKKSLKLVRSN